MKYCLTIIGLLLVACSGCIKNEQGCQPVKPESEETQITTYAAANGITATKHSSGIYYQIINAGSGTAPAATSLIKVGYVGKLLNGTMFDQSTGYSNYLNQLIEGWKIGIPLIKKGGEIKLLIPSSLGYGCAGAGTAIPSNAVLYFDITLIDVQ